MATSTTPAAPPPVEAPAVPAAEVTVAFLQDYRGKLTKEEYFERGSVVEFPRTAAEALIAADRAVEV